MSSVIHHLTVHGDRWDLLAWRYYQDATRLSELLAANPAVPIYPVLPQGLTLSIPILSPPAAPPQPVPPWIAAASAAGELQ